MINFVNTGQLIVPAPIQLQSYGLNGSAAVYVPPGAVTLPFTDDFGRADGGVGGYWLSGSAWQIASGRLVGAPHLGQNVVANGGFDGDTDWSYAADWTLSGGVATVAATGVSTLTSLRNPIIALSLYYAGVTCLNTTGQTLVAQVGSTTVQNITAPGTYQRFIRTVSTNLPRFSAPPTLTLATIDNVFAQLLSWASAFCTVQSPSADLVLEIKLYGLPTTTFSYLGAVVNLDSHTNPQNFVAFTLASNSLQVTKMVNGVLSGVSNIGGAVTAVDGAILRIEKVGTNYKCFYNGVQAGLVAGVTISDASIVDNVRHGALASDQLGSMDDFSLS